MTSKTDERVFETREEFIKFVSDCNYPDIALSRAFTAISNFERDVKNIVFEEEEEFVDFVVTKYFDPIKGKTLTSSLKEITTNDIALFFSNEMEEVDKSNAIRLRVSKSVTHPDAYLCYNYERSLMNLYVAERSYQQEESVIKHYNSNINGRKLTDQLKDIKDHKEVRNFLCKYFAYMLHSEREPENYEEGADVKYAISTVTSKELRNICLSVIINLFPGYTRIRCNSNKTFITFCCNRPLEDQEFAYELSERYPCRNVNCYECEEEDCDFCVKNVGEYCKNQACGVVRFYPGDEMCVLYDLTDLSYHNCDICNEKANTFLFLEGEKVFLHHDCHQSYNGDKYKSETDVYIYEYSTVAYHPYIEMWVNYMESLVILDECKQ